MKKVFKEKYLSLRNRSLIAYVFAFVFLNVLAVIWGSHWLRPAADDYCFAWITAESGVMGSVISSWNSINGYLTSVFYGSLWVGWTLAHLPLSLASSIPFILAAFSLGLVVYYLGLLVVNIRLNQGIGLVFLVAFLWWGFLWVPESFKRFVEVPSTFIDLQLVEMTYGLTYWQTLNGQHILQLACILIGVAIAIGKSTSNSIIYSILILLLGFLSGMTGPTLSLSLAVFVLGYIAWLWLSKSSTPRGIFINLYIFSIATIFGFLITQFLSPGIKTRQAMLGTKFDLTALGAGNILNEAFQYGLTLWVKSYSSLGALFVFLFIAAFFGMYRFAEKISPSQLARIGFLFAIFALLQMVSNRASEFFAYQGYWHFVSAIVCVFLSLIFFGSAAGIALANLNSMKRFYPVLACILVLASGVAMASNYSMIKSIYERQGLWSGGPAPMPGVTDIDVEWVRGCWSHLNKLRPKAIPR
jgi:hypothetical protein